MGTDDDPGRYWATELGEGVVAAMADKYRTTLRLLADPPPVSAEALRSIASRWPGALREAQLVSPWAYRMRHRIVGMVGTVAGGEELGPARVRSSWRGRGAAWLPLWADLHAMLDDQLKWRQRGRDRAASRGWSMFLRDIDDDARSRWPSDPSELEPLGGSGGRLSSRLAYRWLARRAGLSEAALDRILFDRISFDRQGDPRSRC